jgi:hypothetical protein
MGKQSIQDRSDERCANGGDVKNGVSHAVILLRLAAKVAAHLFRGTKEDLTDNRIPFCCGKSVILSSTRSIEGTAPAAGSGESAGCDPATTRSSTGWSGSSGPRAIGKMDGPDQAPAGGGFAEPYLGGLTGRSEHIGVSRQGEPGLRQPQAAPPTFFRRSFGLLRWSPVSSAPTPLLDLD